MVRLGPHPLDGISLGGHSAGRGGDDVNLEDAVSLGVRSAREVCCEPEWMRWADRWLLGRRSEYEAKTAYLEAKSLPAKYAAFSVWMGHGHCGGWGFFTRWAQWAAEQAVILALREEVTK